VSFSGRVALVTGGTAGIGEATVRRLARAGACVLAVGRSGAIAEGLGPLAERVTVCRADLADLSEAERLTELVLRRFGRLDVLVNNAGIDLVAELGETKEEDLRRVFDLNVFAPLLLTAACREPLAATGGCVVNVASRLAAVGVPRTAAYAASKGAVAALTRACAAEFAQLGIRVNAVAPGLTATPMIQDWLEAQADPAAAAAGIPMGRLAAPDDVAAAIAFLASAEAAHVTGVILPVDGGYTAV
jgi:NAD(P)-dependent dehydrogenase (short-subunit alcohol dehydrogenase family)